MKHKTIFLVTTIAFLSLMINANAKEAYGKIIKIKGEGFISSEGKTKALKMGDFIYPNSEVVIEHEGQLSFSTADDQVYHLGKSSSMMIGPKNMVLRAGEVWIQSLNKASNFKVSTANADVVMSGGEGILVYDSLKARTQLVVVSGLMKLNNSRAPEVAISISEGNFSYVDNAYENGIPRDPTPVGEKTYMQLVSHFPEVHPLDKNAVQAFTKDVALAEAKVIPGNKVETNAAADEILKAYRDILVSSKKVKTKSSRGIASVNESHSSSKAKKKGQTPFKVFGEKGEKSMSFGEEFSVTVPKGMRGPASFMAPEVIENKAGDTKVLEEHDQETKKLINELGNL